MHYLCRLRQKLFREHPQKGPFKACTMTAAATRLEYKTTENSFLIRKINANAAEPVKVLTRTFTDIMFPRNK